MRSTLFARLLVAVAAVIGATAVSQPMRHVVDHTGLYTGILLKILDCEPPIHHYQLQRFNVVQGVNELVVESPLDNVWTANGPITCTFTGDYVQVGYYGRSQGTFVCSDGLHGSHTFTRITVQTVGWTRDWSALLSATDSSGCTTTGHFLGTSGPELTETDEP
jgi:hypothetical protein